MWTTGNSSKHTHTKTNKQTNHVLFLKVIVYHKRLFFKQPKFLPIVGKTVRLVKNKQTACVHRLEYPTVHLPFKATGQSLSFQSDWVNLCLALVKPVVLISGWRRAVKVIVLFRAQHAGHNRTRTLAYTDDTLSTGPHVFLI